MVWLASDPAIEYASHFPRVPTPERVEPLSVGIGSGATFDTVAEKPEETVEIHDVGEAYMPHLAPVASHLIQNPFFVNEQPRVEISLCSKPIFSSICERELRLEGVTEFFGIVIEGKPSIW